MKNNKLLPLLLSAVILVLLLVIFGIIWFSNVEKEKVDSYLEVDYETESVNESNSGERELPLESYYTPEDSMFITVSYDDYKSDVDNLNKIINCQYLGDYDFSELLSNMQEDYIKVELSREFSSSNGVLNITPIMSDIFKEVSEVIFNESMYYIESVDNEEDVWIDPNSVYEPEAEQETIETIRENNLTYPASYYDCMRDDYGYYSYELDESKLIECILADNSNLSYDDGQWFLTVSDSSVREYRVLFHNIVVDDTMTQMEGRGSYKFTIDRISVYADNYIMISFYRGSHYFNMKVEKVDGIYRILNINGFISILKEVAL